MLEAKIHRELCILYGPNSMGEGMVRPWVRFFKEGRISIHDESRIGGSSIVSDDLVKQIADKISQIRRFTISDLLQQFRSISQTVLLEPVTRKIRLPEVM